MNLKDIYIKGKPHYYPAIIPFGWGAMVWVFIAVLSGQAEAWDSELYLLVGLPLLIIGSFAMGAAFPVWAWRWGCWMGAGHALAAFLTGLLTGVWFSLLPLSFMILVILSQPLMLFAWFGSLLRNFLNR